MSLHKGETDEKSWWGSEGGSQHRLKWVTGGQSGRYSSEGVHQDSEGRWHEDIFLHLAVVAAAFCIAANSEVISLSVAGG